ncbi:uncharacterized protein [Diabrotica undecimpunctata]|uniref:uncharacterized protein n=1 Tax=Diabrotica undecimpunctata TaxID=50387 RepID=UPI003B639FA7
MSSKSSRHTVTILLYIPMPLKMLMKLPKLISIYTAELTAILNAINFVVENSIKNPVIITDFLSSVIALSNLYPCHPSLLLIKSALSQLQTMNINVNFVWIPSHIGIAGNEEVDSLAKLAISSPEAVEIRSIPHLDI